MKLKSIIGSISLVLLTLGAALLIDPAPKATRVDAADAADALPSAYCMRDEYIVYAQHQDAHGYCWNFAGTTAAATTIMKATGEYYDFSELWTGISCYLCTKQVYKIGAGGTITYQKDAMKKSGLMLETDLPYQYSYTVSNENAVDYYNFYEQYSNDDLASCLVYDSETSFSRTEVEDIKKHIYNHGSIYLTFMFRTGFIESDGAYYLEPNQKNTNSNHAVSVIGWDDNYQKEFYLDGSDTPTVFKGAWIIMNSYTEKSGKDGISLVFYDDQNIGSVSGYRYEPDTTKDLYFYDKIESGYAYPINVKGSYYGDYTAEKAKSKQKNIFYDDVDLEYSYTISDGASVQGIDIYLDNQNVTDQFNVRVDGDAKRFYISKKDAAYGQYKVLVHYGNGEKTDTYLNNFFVTHGLVGEEVELDPEKNTFAFNPGRDLEYYSFISSDKDYVVYTNQLSGSVAFLPTEQSVYSEKNMSIPNISYNIKDGKGYTAAYTIPSNSGYNLTYNFHFEYYEDTTLQPVRVYYDLGGGVNHSKNYAQELASPTTDLALYEPTRPGYTFEGWYLDYGNGSKKLLEQDGVSYVDWEDIHHLGENPGVHALNNYKQNYNNSNTLFVYAHWQEIDYYNVEITVEGEGSSLIENNILVSSEDAVRYFLRPDSGACIASIVINGESLSSEKLIEAMQYGFLLENVQEDTFITVTFAKGSLLSLSYGENVKSAYVVGVYNGEYKKFYDGDCIPKEYFTNALSWTRPVGGTIFPGISDDKIDIDDKFVNDKFDDRPFDEIIIDKDGDDDKFVSIKDDFLNEEFEEALSDNKLEDVFKPVENPIPVIPFTQYGTKFALIVEVEEDKPGYTFVLDDVNSYFVVEQGIYQKNITLNSRDKFAQIDVGTATERAVESVDVTYTAGSNVLDHYISTDANAESGVQNTLTSEAGQIIYLFIKTKPDTIVYHYGGSDGFVAVKDQWYRKAIYVNTEGADLGRIDFKQEYQIYTITWKNWDGSIIYSEEYRYGSTPTFYDRNSGYGREPIKPADDLYSYIFIGWDKRLSMVVGDATYVAMYETVARRYDIDVEQSGNGTVTPNGSNYISRLDKQTYVFIPDTGYRVKDVILNGKSIGAVAGYTFENVTSNQTLYVEFEKIQYSVNVICGANGSTDVTGIVQVEHGAPFTITITPAEFCAIDFIKVNGALMAVSNPLTLESITADTWVEVGFKRVTYHITTESGANGSITPSFSVAAGENARVDFHAKDWYKIKDVKIDGISVGALESYTFIGVNGNHHIVVEYEINTLMIIIPSAAALVVIGAVAIVLAVKLHGKRRMKDYDIHVITRYED